MRTNWEHTRTDIKGVYKEDSDYGQGKGNTGPKIKLVSPLPHNGKIILIRYGQGLYPMTSRVVGNPPPHNVTSTSTMYAKKQQLNSQLLLVIFYPGLRLRELVFPRY